MNNQDILFAGLMGSKALETLARLDIVQNELTKHVLPVIPFLPFQNKTGIETAVSSQNNTVWKSQSVMVGRQDPRISEEKQFFPLSFSFEDSSTRWLFPYEPLISINGGNNIVKRSVAKQGSEKNGMPMTGTIKERWSQKDYEITITGLLFGDLMKGKPEDCYPKTQLTKLLNFLTKTGTIKVFSHPLEILGINQIVIEDFSFPFTKGENVQAYEIKALSDFNYNLLVQLQEPKPENKPNYDFLESNLIKYSK
ncbi:DUF6046 domain-containing protein [Flavobacterium sp. RSP29]|uniref:DUF6046 domain-containing protein n=1 Tax=Flavobacterium sp. RSP29 TaxID=3401731 RepID=UPI003AAAAA3C